MAERTDLDAALERTLGRLRRVRRGERVWGAAGALGAIALAIVALDATLRLPVQGRWMALAALVAGAAGLAAGVRLDRRTRSSGAERAAALLDAARGGEDAPIIAGAQLRERATGDAVAAALARRAVERAGALAGGGAARRAVGMARLRRRAVAAGVVWLAMGAIAVVAPRMLTCAGARVLDPGARLPAWSRTVVAIALPEGEILVGDAVAIAARVAGAAGERVWLETLASDRAGAPAIDTIPMRRTGAGAWSATLRDAREPLYLVARAGEGESAPLRLAPAARPRVERASVTVMGAGGVERSEALAPGGAAREVRARVGDDIALRGTTTIDLGAAIAPGASDAGVEGRGASARWRAEAPGEFDLALTPVGPTGLASHESIAVRVIVEAPGDAGEGAGAIAGAPGEGSASAARAVRGAGDGAGLEGANVAVRASDATAPALEAALGGEALLAIEARALESGALAPGAGVGRVPGAYRERVGAYFLRVLREEAREREP